MSKNTWTAQDVFKPPERYRKEVAAQAHGHTLIGPHGSLPIPGAKQPITDLIPSESVQQQALILWWSGQALERGLDERLLMAFPLQGARSAANGARMKAEGSRKGTPDMFLAVVRGDRAGLWIELKTERKGSKPSPHQLEMLSLLSKDYATVVCRSLEKAKRAIYDYLAIAPS